MGTAHRRHVAWVAAILVLGGFGPLEAQAVRAGRAQATATRGNGLAVTVPRNPTQHDGKHRQDHRSHPGRFAPVVYVPYGTAFRATVHRPSAFEREGTYASSATASAVHELRDATLDARQAALDARQAALDARAAALDLAARRTHERRPAEKRGTLHWKPGGITIAGEGGDNAVGTPAATRTAGAPVVSAAAAVPVTLRHVPAPLNGLVPMCLHRSMQTPPQQRPQERRRFPWGLGWLARYGRDVDVERGAVAPPSFYLRSPLLSGLYRRQDCPEDETPTTCATVTLVGDDDAAVAVDVPLPQLAATSPRALREAIRDGLAADQTVVLRTAAGDEFDLAPGAVREIGARACQTE